MLSLIETVSGIDIKYSAFLQQFLVFLPKEKKKECSVMYRFSSKDEAKNFILEKTQQPEFWWEK